MAAHQPHTLSSPTKACGDPQDESLDGICWLGTGITLDTIAVRLSQTKIWASPIWFCWTKDRTRSRSSSDASLVQRSASFADRSSTARWVAASSPSGATASLTSAPDAKRARRRSSTSPSMSPAGMRRPMGCSERLRVISAVAIEDQARQQARRLGANGYQRDRAKLGAALEDHPGSRRLGFADDQLPFPDVVAERHVAAHPQRAFARRLPPSRGSGVPACA
jgi:hypothetical protein